MERGKRKQFNSHGRAQRFSPDKAAVDVQTATAVSPDTPNVLKAMMKLEEAKTRTKTSNKVALEVEQEKDDDEKTVEELKRRKFGKVVRSDSCVEKDFILGPRKTKDVVSTTVPSKGKTYM